MDDRYNRLMELNNAIFLDKDTLGKSFTKLNSVKIIANVRDEELEQIDWVKASNKKYIVIDMDASNETQQKKFLSIIKDKKYRSFSFDNMKVIVTSTNVDIICDEVLRLLVIY